MADGVGGGGSSLPDILWTFPGQISTDQDPAIFSFKARKPYAFVAFDCNARIAPTGSAIFIDWAVNGNIIPGLRITVAIGATYGETVVAQSLNINDEIRPIMTQVGSSTPGQSLLMRARGS